MIQDYIETFFRLIYPTSFLCFFHQASLLRDWHARTIDISLLKAVCACSLRFAVDCDSDGERVKKWIQEAETVAMDHLGDLSIVRLQVLMLLIFYHSRLRNSSKVWMLSGLAARLAFAKRLNHEMATLPHVVQESRRRLMWSIFIIDKFYSGGMSELTLCTAEDMHIRLPCNERSFAFGVPSETPRIYAKDRSNDMGILAYYIRLLQIRHKILR